LVMMSNMSNPHEFVPPEAEFGKDEKGRIFLIGPKKKKEEEFLGTVGVAPASKKDKKK